MCSGSLLRSLCCHFVSLGAYRRAEVCCLTSLSALSCSYLCSLVFKPHLAPRHSSGLKFRAVSDKLIACLGKFIFQSLWRALKEGKGRLGNKGIDCASLVLRLQADSFHALRFCNRTSGGGQSGLCRMDDPRGTFRAGLPSTAPGTAGSALHHEQTVGKTKAEVETNNLIGYNVSLTAPQLFMCIYKCTVDALLFLRPVGFVKSFQPVLTFITQV